MLSNTEFNLWAEDYDKSVNLSEEANEYPFAGYRKLLNEIYNRIHSGSGKSVLDIGFGTGILTQKLYQEGYQITGIDFSERMLEIAKEKMPKAALMQHDFSRGLPLDLENQKFDCIISTYAIHHLKEGVKVLFINQLLEHLSPNGEIFLGDVAFETTAELNYCQEQSGENWDKEEVYMIFDDLKKHFREAQFHKVSHCAGIVSICRMAE